MLRRFRRLTSAGGQLFPGFGFFRDTGLVEQIGRASAPLPQKLTALRKLGTPYTDEEIAGAAKELEGKTELDALVAYLQGLGLELKNVR